MHKLIISDSEEVNMENNIFGDVDIELKNNKSCTVNNNVFNSEYEYDGKNKFISFSYSIWNYIINSVASSITSNFFISLFFILIAFISKVIGKL